MGENLYIILFILSLIGSAFFSGMEQAYLSSNRLRIEVERTRGSLRGRINAIFYRNQSTMIAMMLLGNNISLVVYGITFGHLLIGESNELWGIKSEMLILSIQTILSTLLVLIGAEFFPKAIASINPNRFLNLGTYPLLLVYVILYLPTQFILFLSLLLLKATGSKMKSSEKVFSKIDLEHYVQDMNSRMKEEEHFGNEIQILQNALDFNSVKARDCMVPRIDIVSVELNDDISILHNKFIETNFSKILVYRENIDNIIGYVHSFEMFKKPESIKQMLLPISFVPEAISGMELLQLFTEKSGNIAVVVDEYGGTAGAVTIEDVIEEIFGEIEDEHDVEDLLEEEINEGEYLFSARHEIDYLNDEYKLNLQESEDYETLGGLILDHLENIPEAGTRVEIDGIIMEITEVSDNRINTVRLYK